MSIFGPTKKEIELQQKISRLQAMLTPEHQDIADLRNLIDDLKSQKDEAKSELLSVQNQVRQKNFDLRQLERRQNELERTLAGLHDDIAIQEFGLYRPTYKFANSDLYKERLKAVRERQKKAIKDGYACTGNLDWAVNGNLSQGKKMVKDMQKLLLRAFNVECDDIIDNVKISNFDRSKERITKSAEQISKLGTIMSISITTMYINLKMEEISLALDFEQKKQEEKEAIREARERQREEARVQKEIEEARKKLQKEQTHYRNALQVVIEQLTRDPSNIDLQIKKRELESNIEDTNKAIADVDYREANKRAGYVYIISNVGAFGDNVYKIGMTRRLEPMERIDELSGASVPFRFDVHALIFTEDAPGLETALHQAFESKKINKINTRREFFRVSLNEIKAEVRKNFDKTVEWIDFPEADQYRQSVLLGSSSARETSSAIPIIPQTQAVQQPINQAATHTPTVSNQTARTAQPISQQTQTLQPIQTNSQPIRTQQSSIQPPQQPQPHANTQPQPTQQSQNTNYCICCKRSGKFLQVNAEGFCPMCNDTATPEQKANAKREAGRV